MFPSLRFAPGRVLVASDCHINCKLSKVRLLYFVWWPSQMGPHQVTYYFEALSSLENV